MRYTFHWTHWTRHFGSLSGSDPKLEDPTDRYIVTTFEYGCNLGPTQTAKYMRHTITPHMLSFVNRRHIHVPKLNAALQDVLNQYHSFSLPKLWGTGKVASADGTKHDMYIENLVSEYNIRYGGIAYHHVADSYIALFSHFIPCGVWEAIYIIDGLLKNKSDIQPDTLHADIQGQSGPVFALSYLLGIKLMPRIRNWKDLKFFRPDKHTHYKHIDPLFKDTTGSLEFQLPNITIRSHFRLHLISLHSGIHNKESDQRFSQQTRLLPYFVRSKN
ncbi:Tn3 family transposase [Bacillus cereus group sp. Bc222]|nr:Tn3 family transposase [Bacillus cereus group sp. Bc222]